MKKDVTVAFFDLDRTLIYQNSGKMFLYHEYKQDRISLRDLFISSIYLLLYHFSWMNIEKAFHRAAKHYKGMKYEDLKQYTCSWFQKEIRHLLLPGAVEAIDSHRKKGHLCVLLSSTSSYLAESAAKDWGLDAWLANCFVVHEDGLLTGSFSEPLCYARGKITWAHRWLEENHFSSENTYFYTDSYSDVEMLRSVKYPRVVNPDFRLRRYARHQGWPVLDWRESV